MKKVTQTSREDRERKEREDELIELLRATSDRAFFFTDPLRQPAIGLHASLLKFPTGKSLEPRSANEQDSPKRYDFGTEGVSANVTKLGVSPEWYLDYGKLGISEFETFGFWNRLEIEYLDNFERMMEAPFRNNLEGYRSHYGCVLATNSGVENGRVVQRPLCELGTNEPVVFASLKINPFLLFTGRSDLLSNFCQLFIFLCEAPSSFWSHHIVREAFARAIRRSSPRSLEFKLEEVEDLIRHISQTMAGAKFIIFQNFGWDDVSIFVGGKPVNVLANFVTFLSELPVFFARFPYQLKTLLLGKGRSEAERLYGALYPAQDAKRDEATLIKILANCSSIYLESNVDRAEIREWIPELPIFCGLTDVYTRQDSINEKVTFGQDIRIFSGALREFLDRKVAGDRIYISSGSVDLFRTVSMIQRGEDEHKTVQSRRSTAFIALDERMIYRRERQFGNLRDALKLLLDRRFSLADLEAIEERLLELRVPQSVVRILCNLIHSHLAYISDPTLVNTLIGYFDLWQNLGEQLLDELRKPATERDRVSLLEKLNEFCEKIGQSMSSRYHSSSRMFEVVDLNPNHRGGVDLFINAYQEFIHIILDSFSGIDRQSCNGLVNVGSISVPKVRMLFGTVIDFDWLRLSRPESCLIILHELGHQLLQDKALRTVANLLKNKDYWDSITNLEFFDELDPEKVWSNFPTVAQLFEDIFCDVLMLRTLERGCGSIARQATKDEIVSFYDRWFWWNAESYFLGSIDGSGRDAYTYRLVSRWYCVRSLITAWADLANDPICVKLRGALAPGADFDAILNSLPSQGIYFPEVVQVPEVEEQWGELLRLAALSSPTIDTLLYTVGPHAGGPLSCMKELIDREFSDNTHSVLDGYLRPFKAVDNAAHGYFCLICSVIDTVLSEMKPIPVLQKIYELGAELVRARDPQIQEACSLTSRQMLFNASTQVFLELSDARLRRLGKTL